MITRIKENLISFWPHILFSIFSFLPLLWFRSNTLYCVEEGLFVNYSTVIRKYLFAWSDYINFGAPATPGEHSLLLPNGVFFFVLDKLGVPLFMAQRVFLILTLFVLFISSYYFFRIFTKNKLIAVLGVFSYVFNLYTANVFIVSAKLFQLILMPLFFLFFYRFLKTSNPKFAIFNFICGFIFQGIFNNLPQFTVAFLGYLFALGYYFAEENKYDWKYTIKSLFLFLLLITPVFIYQILVFKFSVLGIYTQLREQLTFQALPSSLYLLFQGRGSWWEYQGYDGIPYNRWLSFYDSPLLILFSYLLIVICILAMIKKNDCSRKLLIWGFFYTFSLFLAKGSAGPFGFIFKWLYLHVPIFCIFREPWAKFMPLVTLSVSTLIVLAAESFQRRWLNLFLLVILLTKGIPFYGYSFISHANKDWALSDIRPPDYWYDLRKWSENNHNKYVFILPEIKNSYGFYLYNWYENEPGNANLPLYNIFLYFNTASNNLNRYSGVGELVNLINKENKSIFLNNLSVDYFLDQRDVKVKSKESIILDISDVKESGYINKTPSKRFGKLDLYEVVREKKRPFVYSISGAR